MEVTILTAITPMDLIPLDTIHIMVIIRITAAIIMENIIIMAMVMVVIMDIEVITAVTHRAFKPKEVVLKVLDLGLVILV